MEFGPGGTHAGRRGASHVIGVVLLIAITVLLVSAAAVMFLEFGDQRPPQAPSFADDTDFDDRFAPNGQYLNVTHVSGEAIETANVRVAVTDAKVVDPSGAVVADADLASDVFASRLGDEFGASDTFVLDSRAFSNVGAGEYVDLRDATVRFVYDHDPKPETTIIYECEVAEPDCENR